jgi:hypothetical protein
MAPTATVINMMLPTLIAGWQVGQNARRCKYGGKNMARGTQNKPPMTATKLFKLDAPMRPTPYMGGKEGEEGEEGK